MIAEAWKTDPREVPSTPGLASVGSTVSWSGRRLPAACRDMQGSRAVQKQ